MSISASERLRRFLEQFSGSDNVLILINADPDAIASAMAVSRLLWHKVANTAIKAMSGHVLAQAELMGTYQKE